MSTPKFMRRALIVAPALLISLSTANAGDAFKNLTADGEVQGQAGVNGDGVSANLPTAKVTVGIDLIQNVRATIVADLGQALGQRLRKDGKGIPVTFDWEKFVDEAYITIDMDPLTGKPVAMIVGKQNIPLAAEFSKLDDFQDPRYNQNKVRQVYGARIVLSKEAMKDILDEVQMSVFENRKGQYDLDLTTSDPAFAIRVSKRLADNIKAVASYLYEGNNGAGQTEQQASLGLIYTTPKGYELWVEGMWHDNSASFPDADYSISAGVNKQLNEKTTVAASATYVDNTLWKLRAGLIYQLTPMLSIGPEIAYVNYEHSKGKDGVEGTINTKLKFYLIPESDRAAQKAKASKS